MSKLNIGDLAVIVRVTGACSENLGRVVRVIEFDIHDNDLDVKVEADGLLVYNRMSVDAFKSNEAWVNHSWLMPLRGDFQPEREKQQEQPA